MQQESLNIPLFHFLPSFPFLSGNVSTFHSWKNLIPHMHFVWTNLMASNQVSGETHEELSLHHWDPVGKKGIPKTFRLPTKTMGWSTKNKLQSAMLLKWHYIWWKACYDLFRTWNSTFRTCQSWNLTWDLSAKTGDWQNNDLVPPLQQAVAFVTETYCHGNFTS